MLSLESKLKNSAMIQPVTAVTGILKLAVVMVHGMPVPSQLELIAMPVLVHPVSPQLTLVVMAANGTSTTQTHAEPTMTMTSRPLSAALACDEAEIACKTTNRINHDS